MGRRIVIILTVVALLAGGVVLFLKLRPEETSDQVSTVPVRLGELVEKASASGTVEPDVQVAVKSRSSGEVIEVLVSEGDEVALGELLVRLDEVDAARGVREAEVALGRVRADLAQARAQLVVAQAQAVEAEAQSDVRRRGAERGLFSDEERRTSSSSAEVARATITLREAQVRAAQAQVESARLAVDEAQRRLGETRILAPVAGTVLSVEVERGSIVASGITNVSGGSTLMTIADLSDLRVIGDLDEAQVGQVQKGQPVVIRVDAFPQQTFEGKVYRVSPLGVETTNVVTFDVEIVITDTKAQLLRSGMSADLEIVTAHQEKVLLIPILSLQGRSGHRFVTLASGDRRPVKTGTTDGTDIVILEGLSEGDQIVGSVPQGHAEGQSKEGGGPRRGMMPFGPPPPR